MLGRESGGGAVEMCSRKAAVGASVVALAGGLLVEIAQESDRVVGGGAEVGVTRSGSGSEILRLALGGLWVLDALDNVLRLGLSGRGVGD